MLRSMQRCLSGSCDTSQGMWVWLPAVMWLLDFVARLVRQLRLIPVLFSSWLCSGAHRAGEAGEGACDYYRPGGRGVGQDHVHHPFV